MSRSTARPYAAAAQALLVLLTCAGLAAGSLAATSGGGADRAAAVVAAARSHVGDRYVWGGNGPDAFDCSGLTSTVWSRTGKVRGMPRTSAQQQAWAVPLPAEQARVGDLVFFGAPVTHVGLVSGRRNGQLLMVDASASRKAVVERVIWRSGVVRFGRVPRPGMPPVRPWRSHPAPLVAPGHPLLYGKAPLAGLPRRSAPATHTMRRYAGLARQQVGSRRWTDNTLVTVLEKRAGGAGSPASRVAIRNRTHRVLLRDARVGDVVVYPSPNGHVGIYLGGGWMVDASRALGRVVVRPVWDAPGVQVLRWSR